MWLYVFAICTLLLLGCVVRAAARLEGHWRWPSLTIVPSMCGMWVGWAMGDASVELLTRLNAHAQNFRFCTSCNGFNILFSFGFTIVTAVLMLMLRPITRAAALSSSKAAMSPRHGGGAYAGACRYACSSFIAWGVAVAELLAQGLSYNVMMLWGFTFKHVITWGVSYTQSGTPLLGRTLFLWAAFLTVIGSMLTVRLSKWRLWLERRQNLVRRDLNLATPRSLRAREQPSSEELPATISDAQMPPVHLPAASGVPPTGVPPTGVLPTGVTESHPPLGSVSSAASGGGAGGAPGCALSAAQVDGDASGCDAVASSFHSPPPPTTFSRCSSFTPSALLSGFEPSRLRPAVAENVAKTLAQIDRRLGRRVALGQFLVLLEASLAWVAGVAWTDAVVELSEMRIYPDPSVVFHDTLLALLATILAFVITIATGSSFSDLDDKQKASREAVEGYFTMYALSFIVGWGWVVVLRDYETLLANMVTSGSNWQRLDYAGEGLLVAIFGPGLTVLLIKTKRASFSTWCCSARAIEPLIRKQDRRQESLRHGAGATAPVPRHLGGGEMDEELSDSVRKLMVQVAACAHTGGTADGIGEGTSGGTQGVDMLETGHRPLLVGSRGTPTSSSDALGSGRGGRTAPSNRTLGQGLLNAV